MAEMIPDRLPSGASAGERKVFALLQQLLDEVIVYYEPVVADRYPDFIVIIPSVGLLVIEAKGWYPNHILKANNVEVTISPRGQPEIYKHPVRQARDYQFQLMDTARRHSETAALLHGEGAHGGRFTFPFGHLVVLNNCTQLDERGLSEVFPSRRVLARDELEALSPDETINRLKSCFDPWWVFGRLSERQISMGWANRLASLISQQTAVYWPHDPSGSFVDLSGVCVRTMHSAKGLQWRAVLVMRCDMMPFLPASNVDRAEQERLERGLMYVAMTRAEETLAFTRSTLNGFGSRIQKLLDQDVVRLRQESEDCFCAPHKQTI